MKIKRFEQCDCMVAETERMIEVHEDLDFFQEFLHPQDEEGSHQTGAKGKTE